MCSWGKWKIDFLSKMIFVLICWRISKVAWKIMLFVWKAKSIFKSICFCFDVKAKSKANEICFCSKQKQFFLLFCFAFCFSLLLCPSVLSINNFIYVIVFKYRLSNLIVAISNYRIILLNFRPWFFQWKSRVSLFLFRSSIVDFLFKNCNTIFCKYFDFSMQYV